MSGIIATLFGHYLGNFTSENILRRGVSKIEKTLGFWPGRSATEERNRETLKMAGHGAEKSAGAIRGAEGSVGLWQLKGLLLLIRFQGSTAPLPALPPPPRIAPALFPAPSPAIFCRVSPFLSSIRGPKTHPKSRNTKKCRVYANFFEKFARTFPCFPATRVRNPTKIVQINSFR